MRFMSCTDTVMGHKSRQTIVMLSIHVDVDGLGTCVYKYRFHTIVQGDLLHVHLPPKWTYHVMLYITHDKSNSPKRDALGIDMSFPIRSKLVI